MSGRYFAGVTAVGVAAIGVSSEPAHTAIH